MEQQSNFGNEMIAFAIMGFQALIALIALVILAYLVYRRIQLKKGEDFEKRSN